jgi:hypothetical protein
MPANYTARGTQTSVLTTELNSLASAAVCTASAAQDNDTAGTRDTYAQFEVYLAAQGSNRTAGASISLYLVPESDGTNYGNTTDECLDNYLAWSWGLDDAALAARYLIADCVRLPVGDWKALIKNSTGQAFASSGNTVKYRVWTYEDAT